MQNRSNDKRLRDRKRMINGAPEEHRPFLVVRLAKSVLAGTTHE